MLKNPDIRVYLRKITSLIEQFLNHQFQGYEVPSLNRKGKIARILNVLVGQGYFLNFSASHVTFRNIPITLPLATSEKKPKQQTQTLKSTPVRVITLNWKVPCGYTIAKYHQQTLRYQRRIKEDSLNQTSYCSAEAVDYRQKMRHTFSDMTNVLNSFECYLEEEEAHWQCKKRRH